MLGWRDFAGGNEDIYTPLDSILAAVQQSGLCRSIALLTGDFATAEALCRNGVCDAFNNSGLEYYIQASALDFHRALVADVFIGNVRSTFSGLVIDSRNFERAYTYSRFNEVTCTRPVFRHDQKNAPTASCPRLPFSRITSIENTAFRVLA